MAAVEIYVVFHDQCAIRIYIIIYARGASRMECIRRRRVYQIPRRLLVRPKPARRTSCTVPPSPTVSKRQQKQRTATGTRIDQRNRAGGAAEEWETTS